MAHFYPRSPCGERRKPRRLKSLRCVISIHALLAESDGRITSNGTKKLNFYPRSPCGERQPWRMYHTVDRVFLSTLSLRRATPRGQLPTTQPPNFYPRSPCGERHCDTLSALAPEEFLSTLSLRRATAVTRVASTPTTVISIHALLAESDISCARSASKLADFYPRSPCGERRPPVREIIQWEDFYPRSPCGERRPAKTAKANKEKISIHALLAESDHAPNRRPYH